MPGHKQPTPEEIAASLAKTIEDLDKIPVPPSVPGALDEEEDKTTPPTPPKEEDEEEDKTTPPVPPTPPAPVKEEDEEDKTTPPKEEDEEEEEESQEDKDYKKKFIESSRETQIAQSVSRKINEAIEKGKTLPLPTDEEMTTQFADWEEMTDSQKKIAKDNERNNRRLALLDEVTQESKDIEVWNTKVDTFIKDPKILTDTPELEGKQEDFKIYAMKKGHRGSEFDVLISAFLHDHAKMVEGNKIKNKNKKMFPQGRAGGPPAPPKGKDKLTIEEGAALKQQNYEKYKTLLRAGKIETDF